MGAGVLEGSGKTPHVVPAPTRSYRDGAWRKAVTCQSVGPKVSRPRGPLRAGGIGLATAVFRGRAVRVRTRRRARRRGDGCEGEEREWRAFGLRPWERMRGGEERGCV